MKKILALVLMLALAACIFAVRAEDAAVMSHEEFIRAKDNAAVCIEAYVQDSQAWKGGSMNLYLQSEDGAYFVYSAPMTEEEAKAIVPGVKVRVSGKKAEWAGEVEITDVASFTVLEAEPWIAEAEDITAIMGSEELSGHMNEKIIIKGAKVIPSAKEGDSGEYAFLYDYDGSGSRDNPKTDLYFKVEAGGTELTLTVESGLRNSETEAYKAVEALQIGDVIDIEGFLYWYNEANPHVTAVSAAE